MSSRLVLAACRSVSSLLSVGFFAAAKTAMASASRTAVAAPSRVVTVLQSIGVSLATEDRSMGRSLALQD
jgi:hypothetical protein